MILLTKKTEKQKLLESGKVTVVCESDTYEFIYETIAGEKIPIVKIFGSDYKLDSPSVVKETKEDIKKFKDVVVLGKDNLGK